MIALYTLIRQEFKRMCRIWVQAFLGPIISIFLYFLIFGNVMSERIGAIQGIPYLEFITPGLILISIINTSYMNVSSSLFICRFQKNIEEILVSPVSNNILLLGFILSGIIRGILVALMITLIVVVFFHVNFNFQLIQFIDILLTSAIFSLIGFINGLYAKDFDDIAFIPSFILTPLCYLGGVFYSIGMLPSPWQEISKYNPLFYIIDMFRTDTLNLPQSSTLNIHQLIIVAIIILFFSGLKCMQRGLQLKK